MKNFLANKTRNAVLLFVLVLSFTSSAFAMSVVLRDFSDSSLLTLNRSAATTTTSDGVVLRLTPATTNQAGSAFSSASLNAGDFSTFFKFRITEPGGRISDCNTEAGADGLVFVVQSISSDIGGAGAGIGYAGIGNSVGVEFDTWCNAGNNDPSSNHVGIVTDGNVNHGSGSPHTANVSPNFDDGNVWYAWIDYDGTTLEVRFSQNSARPATPLLSRTLDIPAILGQGEAFVGFTSGTGADWGNHDIIAWEYRDTFEPIPGSVCDADHLQLCTTQADCENAGGYWHEDMCNSSPQHSPGVIYACDNLCEAQCEEGDIACVIQCTEYQDSCCVSGEDICVPCPELEPPMEHTVEMCNSTCQETAPVQVSDGQADICFNYLRPVTALAGFMSPDFTTIWWVAGDCNLSTTYTLTLEDSKGLSCSSLTLPPGVIDGGYCFWLVTEENLFSLDWIAGLYELKFYGF